VRHRKHIIRPDVATRQRRSLNGDTTHEHGEGEEGHKEMTLSPPVEKKKPAATKKKPAKTESSPATKKNAKGVAPTSTGAPVEEGEPLLSPIAKPLASGKLSTQVLALIQDAAKDQKLLRGTKAVAKGIQKQKKKGIVVFAADVSPIDVIAHLPVLCEDAKIPYVFVRSKQELGTAAQIVRCTSVIMVSDAAQANFSEAYLAVYKQLENLPHS